MSFISLQFVIFLVVVLCIYYSVRHSIQNVVLIVASCIFYASWDWRFLIPLMTSTSIDYWCAAKMERQIAAGLPKEYRRPFLWISIVTNIGLLAFFKYFNFFAGTIQSGLTALGYPANIAMLEIVLPLGISFYTFQALSYTIDVYRGELHAARRFPTFLLGILYFPHLVAGPIQRSSNLLPQIVNPRVITAEKLIAGCDLIVWGAFKKVCLADNLAPIVNAIFANPNPTGFQTLMAAYAFAFQIYCDFSGYTDIARGLAKVMGFEFVLNFKTPYFATNPRDFWARWHISLSTWLRDYLYIPLGGNKRGELRTLANLMITMVLGGLWHGAHWNFVLWGAYQGLLLVGYRLCEPGLRRASQSFSPAWRPITVSVSVFAFFHVVCYGWLLFRAESLNQIHVMTASLLDPVSAVDMGLMTKILFLASPIILEHIFQYFPDLFRFVTHSRFLAEVRAVWYAVLSYLVLFRGGDAQSFIYFQF